MSVRGAVILFNSSAMFQPPNAGMQPFPAASGSSLGPSVQWYGGRTALTVCATTYPVGLQVQMLGPDNSSWFMVGSSVLPTAGITTQQNYTFDANPGTYRVIANSGLAVALYVTLCGIPYGI